MNGRSATAPLSLERAMAFLVKLGLAALGLLLLVLLVVTGNVALVLGFIVAAVASWGVLHMSVARLLPLAVFITFVIDNPAEQPYSGEWTPWWSAINDVWFENVRKTLPGTALPLSPIMLILAACAIRATSSAINQRRDRDTLPLRRAAALSLVTLGALEVFGILTGGKIDTSLRQVLWLAAMPVVAIAVVAASLSSPALLRRIEIAVVASAFIKAVVAIILYFTVIKEELSRPITYTVTGAPIVPPEYLSTHSDSVLWLWALLLLGGYWLEGRRKGSMLTLVLLGSPMFIAIVWNSRRTTWVELAGAILFSLALARPALKKQIGKLVTVGWPLGVAYVAIGWNLASPIFAPVASLRSIFNSSDDSNITRDAENLNLIFTFRARPITGWGFGHPYLEVVKSFDISTALAEYLYIPHNSMLALFAFAGPIGFLGFWAVVVVAVTLCVKGYRLLPHGRQGPVVNARARAGWAAGGLIAYALQGTADIGLQAPYCAIIAGLCVGIAGANYRNARSVRNGLDAEQLALEAATAPPGTGTQPSDPDPLRREGPSGRQLAAAR